MKKIIGIGILIIIVFVVSAPYVNGLILEKTLRNAEGSVNDLYADQGSGVTFAIRQYDREYASSEIEWVVNLGSLSTLYGVEEVVFVEHARHGFTGVVSTTSLDRNPWFSRAVDVYLNGENPLHMTTTYRIGGDIESAINIDAFSVELEGETLAIKPLTVHSTLDPGLTHLVSTVNGDGFSVADQIALDGLALRYDLKKISSLIWAGTMAGEIKNLSVTGQGENLVLQDLKSVYTMNYDPEKNLLSSGGTLDIEHFESGQQEADRISARIDVANIDAAGYEEFFQLYSQTISSMMEDYQVAIANPDGMDDAMQQRMQTAGLQLMAAFEKLLTEGLEFKVSNVRAQLPQGNIDGEMTLRLTQDITFAQLAFFAMDPNLLLDFISLQSNLRFPAELVPDPAPLVSPIYQGMPTGLFVQNGTNLEHNAQTKNGKLFLNGQEFRLN